MPEVIRSNFLADCTEFRFSRNNLSMVMILQQGMCWGFFWLALGLLCAKSIPYIERDELSAKRTYEFQSEEKGGFGCRKAWEPLKSGTWCWAMPSNSTQGYQTTGVPRSALRVHREKSMSSSGRDLWADLCQKSCYWSSEWQTRLQKQALQNNVPVCSPHAVESN